MNFNMIPLPTEGTFDNLLSAIETNRVILNAATWKAIAQNRHSDVVSIAELLEEMNFIERMAVSVKEGRLLVESSITSH